MTQLLYVFLLLIVFFSSYQAQKTRKKTYLYLTILIFTFIAGFRGMDCGVDTSSYYDDILRGFPYPWHFKEEGFRLVANFFVDTFNNPQLMFIFCAFATNLLICLRLWDYREDADFSFLILLYILMFFSNSMNIMRQYVAVALIFYGTRFLKNKKWFFIPFLALAFFFHRSSLLSIWYLGIVLWSGFSKTQKKLFLIPIVAIIVLSFAYVAAYLATDIQAYRSQEVDNVNITYFYLLFITIFTITVYRSKFAVKINSQSRIGRKNIDSTYFIDRNLIIYTLVGLGFSALSMFFAFVGRTGLYYSIYSVVFWGIACKKFKCAQINKVLILVYAFYVFSLVFFRNSCGLFPYEIFFYK